MILSTHQYNPKQRSNGTHLQLECNNRLIHEIKMNPIIVKKKNEVNFSLIDNIVIFFENVIKHLCKHTYHLCLEI